MDARQFFAADPIERLTVRERQIADLVADGLTNQEIGLAIFVAENTVKFHLTKIFRKLGVRNRAEIATAVVLHRRGLAMFDLERKVLELEAALAAEREQLAFFKAGLWSLAHIDTDALRALALAVAERPS